MAVRMLSCLLAVNGLAAASALGHAAHEEDSEVVSFVQRTVSEQQVFQQKEFDPEDAESLVSMAYEAAHDESRSTLEDKAVGLLQRLAEHHSVQGTGAAGALRKAAAAAAEAGAGYAEGSSEYEATGSGALGAEAEAEADLGLEFEALANGSASALRPFDGWWFVDGRNKFEWETIKGEGGEDEGYCWHKLGSKPLQCQINVPSGMDLEDMKRASNWEKYYKNPCEALCGRRSWCSGYGYKRIQGQEICTLFDKGTGLCKGNRVTLQGLLPVHSARDLVLKPAGDKNLKTKKNGVDIRLKYLSRQPDSAYVCKAKYKDPPGDSFWMNKGVSFETKSEDTKCQHVLSTARKPVYLDEVRVLKMSLALMDPDSVWENQCEKLCSMFSWCSGYAYREKAENVNEACGLYTKQKDPVKSDGSWVSGTKPRAAHEPGLMSTHFVRDPAQPGFICKAKIYATKWRTSAGASIQCKSNFAGILKSSVMMIVNILYLSKCDSIASSVSDSATTTTTTVAANSSSNDSLRLASHMDSMGSFDPVQLTRLASHMDSMGSFDPVQLTRLFPPESRVAAENFTFGPSQARTAVAELLKDSDEDARAIAKLRAKRSRSNIALRCKFAFTGQVFRFLLFSLATSVSNIYQCKMLHKERYRCEADLLRVTGGLFGALMYGYPRITLECGSIDWPPTTFTCAGDFIKSTMFLGKTIWTIVQTYNFVDEDKDIEKAAGGIDAFASLGFITEGILRALGPCLGHLSGDDSKVVLPNGACLGTYTEVSAISMQTFGYSVLSYTQCRDWFRADAHQK